MAPGTFFNPRTLLLVTPLVSSTCTLWFSRDQEFFLRIFTSRIDEEQANDVLPPYITAMFNRGTSAVVGLIGVTFSSSLANIWLYRPILQSRGSLRWYSLTAALALGHLAWVPAVAWKLKTIMDDASEDEGTTNVATMRRWLKVNLIRMLTTDLSAWLCAVAAITTTLSV
ncbi:hypothetical protein EDB81DRAFT_267265 [Dactylonectria macrodidyma]|uniref:Integral membrane protein n=1 Tax=Dactylonectria macrodidyma TaxID=307937 RepID=A0A9P9FKQ7_9HYPO|nr:hypothetical protein EDB81DRAFT_267265 [Dactylonectria macrodidyma]